MKKILLIIATYLLFTSLNAQSFEYLDNGGFCYGYEDQNNNFFLTKYSGLDERSVLALSAKGDSLWSGVYQIGEGPVLSNPIFMEGLNSELVIFYNKSFHYATSSSEIRISCISPDTGELLKDEDLFVNGPNESSSSKEEKAMDLKLNESTYSFLYQKRPRTNLILSAINEDLEILSRDTLVGHYNLAFLSDYEEMIYATEHEVEPFIIKKINYNGDILGELDLGNMTPVSCGSYRLAENQDYIVIVQPSCERDQGSHIFVIEQEEFKVVQSNYFDNVKINDVKLLANNQIIAVQTHYGKPELSPEQPVKVMLLDESLNVIKENHYGYPATKAQYIAITNDQKGFYVSGYRSAQSESYFLKDDFSSLEPVYRPMDEAPLGVNVFPNPTAGLVKVLIDPAVSLPVGLRLVSTAGQVMQELSVTTHTLNLDLSALPIGVYHLVLESGEGSRTEKIVKMW